jgi:hypothetical protein
MLSRCEGLRTSDSLRATPVTPAEPSTLNLRIRKVLLKLVINASFICEPVRVKRRKRLLDKILLASPLDSQNSADSPPVLLLMVYRLKNTQLVEALLGQIGLNAEVRLWALDQVAPELSDRTLGCGAGLRFSHLNWLYDAKPVQDGSWLVMADDDFLFVKGGLRETIHIMQRAGLVLAQPGQSLLGWWSSLFNVARPLIIARDTNYVEQGPILIADPTFVNELFPLPEDNDMGWGIEATWFRLKEGRCRIGVVDACRIVHWAQNATSYSAGPEIERMNERLTRAGISSIWQLQSVNNYWWKWQRIPSWPIVR